MNNNPTTWKITLADFDDPKATWGRTIIIDPRIQTTSYFYANLPLYIRRGMRDSQGNLDMTKLESYFNNKAQEVINGIVYKYRVLSYLSFTILMPSIQLNLQHGVYLALNKLLLNTFNEVTEASSISTNNLTIDQDITNWLTISSFVGTPAYKKIQLSGIRNYEIVWDNCGNFLKILYNNKPVIISFKTYQIVSDTEINTTNPDSLLTRKQIEDLIKAGISGIFKTGEDVSLTSIKKLSTEKEVTLLSELYLNDLFSKKQDSLTDLQINSINSIPNLTNDVKNLKDDKLNIKDLYTQLKLKLKAGNNITFDLNEENETIIINSTGGGGGSFTCNDLDSCLTKIKEIVGQDFYNKTQIDNKLSTVQELINAKQNKLNNGEEHEITIDYRIEHTKQWDDNLTNRFDNKQNQRDESLETSAKYIVNAINEVNSKPSRPHPYLSFDETDTTPWFKGYYGQNEVEFKGTLNELITMLKTKFQDKPFVRGTIALFYNQTSYLHGEFMWLRTSNQSATIENIKLDMYGAVPIPSTTRTIKSVNIFLVKNDSDDDTWNEIYGLIGVQSFQDTETQLFTGTTGEQIAKQGYPETKMPEENLNIFNNSTYFVLGYYGTGRGAYTK